MKGVLLFSKFRSLLLTKYPSDLAKGLTPAFPVEMKHLGQYSNMIDTTYLFLFFKVHASTIFFVRAKKDLFWCNR